MASAPAPVLSADPRPPTSDLHAFVCVIEGIVEFLRHSCVALDAEALSEVSLRAGVQSRQSGMSHTAAGFAGVLKRVPRYHALLKLSADAAVKGSSKRTDGCTTLASLFAKELHYTSTYHQGHFRAAVLTGPPVWHHCHTSATAPVALVLFPPDHADTGTTHVYLPTGLGAPASCAVPQAPTTSAWATCAGLRATQQVLRGALCAAAQARPAGGDGPGAALATLDGAGGDAALVQASAFSVCILRRRKGKGGGGTVASSASALSAAPSLLGPPPPPQAPTGPVQPPWEPAVSPTPEQASAEAGSGVQASPPRPLTEPPPAATQSDSPVQAQPRRVRVRRGGAREGGHAEGPRGTAPAGEFHLGDTVAFDPDAIPWATEAQGEADMPSPVRGAVQAATAAANLVGTLQLAGGGGVSPPSTPTSPPPPEHETLAQALARRRAARRRSGGGGGPTPGAPSPWSRAEATGELLPGTPQAETLEEPDAGRGSGHRVQFNPPESPPQTELEHRKLRTYESLRRRKEAEAAARKEAWAAARAGEDLDLDGGRGGGSAPVAWSVSAPDPQTAQARDAASPPPDTTAGGSVKARGRAGASNAARVRNALKAVCLAGVHKQPALLDALAAMQSVERGPEGRNFNFVVLFRSPSSRLYKGLFAYDLSRDELVKVHGGGPKRLGPGAARDARMRGTFKYSTGRREFEELPTNNLSVMTDGIALALASATKQG